MKICKGINETTINLYSMKIKLHKIKSAHESLLEKGINDFLNEVSITEEDLLGISITTERVENRMPKYDYIAFIIYK